MNRIERLTAILLFLQEKPRTAAAIAQRFEVSKRTVLRDMQALSEMGVPLIAREGAGGGYALPDDYSLAPLALTTREAFLLLLALSSINQLSDAPFAPERASLQAKVRALLPPQQLPQLDQMLVTVNVTVPERPQRAPFLDELIAAAQQGRWVCVTYHSAERASTQHLWPRQITTQHGFWYCLAFSHERREERMYRVDRIRSLQAPDERFHAKPPSSPQPYDHASHPEIVIALTPRGVALLESDTNLGTNIQRNTDGSGRIAFRCPPGELKWYARYFVGFGADLTVVAPETLRAEMRQLGEKIVEQYP